MPQRSPLKPSLWGQLKGFSLGARTHIDRMFLSETSTRQPHRD